jgi:hypothetical protein
MKCKNCGEDTRSHSVRDGLVCLEALSAEPCMCSGGCDERKPEAQEPEYQDDTEPYAFGTYNALAQEPENQEPGDSPQV